MELPLIIAVDKNTNQLHFFSLDQILGKKQADIIKIPKMMPFLPIAKFYGSNKPIDAFKVFWLSD